LAGLFTLTKEEKQLSCEGVYSFGEQDDKLNTEPLLVVFTRDSTDKFLSGILKDKKLPSKHLKKVRCQVTSTVETTNVAHHFKSWRLAILL